jgi:hypothetical protein
MLMDLLFEGRFEEYLEAAALPPEGLCLFVHVPKTAGTSLRAELARLLRPDANIVVDYTDTDRSFHERMDEAVARFLAPGPARPPRFASGHILERHVRRISAARPGTRLVTFLRDPVARVVSDYRYQRSPRHPVHAEFAARVPDLASYIDLRWEANKMAQHLVPAELVQAGDPARCVDFVMRHYAFIGVQEFYALSFRALTALLGAPGWPSIRENVNGEDPSERAVPDELAARIRAANALDDAIYQHVLRGWQRGQPTLVPKLARL